MKLEQLDGFEPFHDLDEQSKLIAAKLIQFDVIQQGTHLFELGENDNIEYFLYEGDIELIAVDGIKKTISAGDSGSHFPLALLRPRKFSATISSKTAKIIHVDVDVLHKLRKSIPVVGDSFSVFASLRDDPGENDGFDTNFDSVKQFLVSTKSAIIENRLTIANFDDVSNTIFNVIQQKDVSLDVIISAVQLDAAISAKLIKAANSAFYSGMEPADSVRAAVVRLGLDLSIQLITVMVLKEVFASKNEALEEAMHNIWQSSLKLATYSVVIGKRAKLPFQQGQTLLAGLMSEMGSLVIIAFLDQFPGMAISISDHVLSSVKIKNQLGKALLKHWGFSKEVIAVVEHSDDIKREIEITDIGDVVCLAKMLIRLTSYRKMSISEITELPAFKRMGFDPECPTLIGEIMEEARHYIRFFYGASKH